MMTYDEVVKANKRGVPMTETGMWQYLATYDSRSKNNVEIVRDYFEDMTGVRPRSLAKDNLADTLLTITKHFFWCRARGIE